VWYSGQQRGFLGRFDPKTGKMEKLVGRDEMDRGVVGQGEPGRGPAAQRGGLV